MKLFVDCLRNPASAPDGETGSLHHVTEQEILQLMGNIPHDLLHQEVIRDLADRLNKNKTAERRRVARGTPPIPGRDGRLLLLAKPFRGFIQSEDLEIADAHHLRFFDNIEKGTTIARIYPPHAGTPGVDAMGVALPAEPGRPIKPSFDHTIVERPAPSAENYTVLIADDTGYLAEERGALSIRAELVVPDDVCFRTGDIDFVGRLTIRGSVMKDFHVSARHDISIGGSVLDAFLSSAEGSIRIAGGVSGPGTPPATGTAQNSPAFLAGGAQIRAAGKVSAELVRGVSIEAGADIELEQEASTAILYSRRALLMQRGHLIGGEVSVVGGVEAETIGTQSGTRTTIRLCGDVESSVEYSNLQHRLRQHTTAREMLEMHLGPYAKNPSRISLLQQPHRDRMHALHQKLQQVLESLSRIEHERAALLAKAHHAQIIRVNFRRTLHAGTVLIAGPDQFTAADDITGPGTLEYHAASHEFRLTEPRPLDSEEEPQPH